MLKPFWSLTVVIALQLADAHAQIGPVPRTPVERFEPLLHAALRAEDGAAHGVLTGPVAAAISRRFNTAAPIRIDVSTLLRYAQEGCSRLRVDVAQQGVRLPSSAAAAPQHVRFELNYCTDGMPPRTLAVRGQR